MKIEMCPKGDVIICNIEGDIDINTAPEAKKVFDKIAHDRQKKILFNMEKVAYVDSSGLATLVAALKGFKGSGGRLKLINLTTKVKSLFEITKLEKLFDIRDSEEDALKTFA